jgi:CheY-like chemotaxis protein
MSGNETAQAQIRVLAVDDDESTLKILNALLRDAGHKVFLARSGEECIRIARQILPDIVLLDVDMPGMNGYEAAEALSGHEGTRSIPIIMVTAHMGERDRLRALKDDDPNRYHYRFLDKVQVTGKEEWVSVYEVYDADPSDIIEHKSRTREIFEKGVYEYHAGHFVTAYEMFASVRREKNSDRPLDIYARRCRRSMTLGAVENMVGGPMDT